MAFKNRYLKMAFKTKILVTVSTLFLIFATLVWQFGNQKYQISLSEEQILTKLNEKFPYKKTYFFIIDLNFLNPQLALENGSDRIAFGCDVETNLKIENKIEDTTPPLRGSIKLSGTIRYDATAGEFFLDEPRVEKLDIDGIPDKWRSKLNNAITHAIPEFLSHAPIYKLHPTDIKKAAIRLFLLDVKVINKNLIITMGVNSK